MSEDLRKQLLLWMERERIAYADVARTLHVPTAAVIRVPTITELREDGWSMTSREITISPFALPSYVWHLQHARMVESTLAQPLYEEFDGALRYWEFGDYDSDPEVWITEHVLSRVAVSYLRRLSSLDVPDPVLAEHVVSKFLAFATGQTIDVVTLIPLAGLRIGDATFHGGGLTIRPLTSDELAELSGEPSMGRHALTEVGERLYLRDPWVPERVLLEARESVPKGLAPNAGKLAESFLLAVQLRGFEPFGRGRRASYSEPFSVGTISGSVSLPRSGTVWREFTKADFEAALALAALIPATSFDSSSVDRKDVAIQRFRAAMSEASPAEAVIDYVIALEAALLPREAGTEVRLRFCLYGAWLIAKSADERTKLFAELQRVYDTRSQLVHGSAPPSERVTQDRSIARRLAACVLTVCLTDGWPRQDDLRRRALGG